MLAGDMHMYGDSDSDSDRVRCFTCLASTPDALVSVLGTGQHQTSWRDCITGLQRLQLEMLYIVAVSFSILSYTTNPLQLTNTKKTLQLIS